MWFQLFYKEIKWLKTVNKFASQKDIAILESRRKKSDRAVAFGMLTSLFLNSKSFKKPLAFVNLKNYPFVGCIEPSQRLKFIFCESNLKHILAGQSLKELDAIYHLIHNQKINSSIRKILLYHLIKKVEKYVLPSNSVFILHQDYYEKGSILTTLGLLKKIRVVGVQHGLMPPKYLVESKIYPGIRTSTEFVLNASYAMLMTPKKAIGSETLVAGEILFRGKNEPIADSRKLITFVSSGDLSKEKTKHVFKELSRAKTLYDYTVTTRPHPSEVSSVATIGLDIDKRSKTTLFDIEPTNQIFVGFYSTLLYQASTLGFKTIWITNGHGDEDTQIEILELRGALVIHIHDFKAEVLHNLFSCIAKKKEAPHSTELYTLLNNIRRSAKHSHNRG
jgi:hypothetical protein